MPRLSELTDYDPMGNFTGTQPTAAPVEAPSPLSNNVDKILNSIFRPDEKRLQLWPERLVRAGATAAGEVASGAVPQWAIDPKTGDVHTSPEMVEKAQEVSALAGSGGLASGGGSLNATPSLRPALRHKEKLYKGKPGQEHQDIIPDSLYNDFQKKAMKGEDLADYNFGFVNDKGHFLSREDALKYGIDNGIIDQQAGKFGTLTSTMFADSSKPGVAIESLKTAPKTPEFKKWFGDSKVVNETGEPLVVYHGTKADFNTFDIKKHGASDEGLAGKGFYFTYNPEEASGYALNEMWGKGNSPNVIPAYVSLKNPLVIKNGVLPNGKTIKDMHGGNGINSKGGNAIRELAEKEGHDGVIFASKEGKSGHIVAFEPEQIKSSTGNSGKFDPKDASMLKSDVLTLPPGYELKPVEFNPFELKS